MFRTVDGAIPNVTLKRMSEGADDCRFAYKLLALIKEANEKGSDRAKATAIAAKKAYDDILAAIRIDTGRAKIEIDGRCDLTADSTDVFDGSAGQLRDTLGQWRKLWGKHRLVTP